MQDEPSRMGQQNTPTASLQMSKIPQLVAHSPGAVEYTNGTSAEK